MIIRVFGPNGVIYAPSSYGKTRLIQILVEELRAFKGRRGNAIESTTLSVETWDRKVISEGGFFHWLLHECHHANANRRQSPVERRHDVYEFLKGEARKHTSGRLILLVDEAQRLELTELGWFADIFNALRRDGFSFILFLVGSYHLQEWIDELEGGRHEHVRTRFFSKQQRLRGVSSLDDFRRCLKRYDVDTRPLDGKKTIAAYYQPKWCANGGRLEKHATELRAAFQKVSQRKPFEVPMAWFSRAVIQMLDRSDISEALDDLDGIVETTSAQ